MHPLVRENGRLVEKPWLEAMHGLVDRFVAIKEKYGPDAIAGLVAILEAQAGTRGTVGVAIPGAVSPATGLVKNANSTWLNGRPLQHDLARRLDREVRLANDANCFALSEATDGAAPGAAVVFGVILGTGTGGGLVVNGRLVVGANAIAGEWGGREVEDSLERGTVGT